MLVQLLGAVAAAVLTALAMHWAMHAFPSRPDPGEGATLEELAPRYGKWEGLFVSLYLASWVPVTYVLWRLLRALADWNASLLGPADFVLTAEPLFWLLPAFFAALVLPGAPLTWLARRMLGPRFAEYDRYLVLKHRYDYARANRAALRVTGWGCALAVFLGLDWYVLVRDDALVVNGLVAVTDEVRPYADIRSIRTASRFIAPNGSVKERREWLVTFADGGTWSTFGLPAEQTELQKAAMVGSISARAGVTVEEIAVFEKYALW